MIKYVILVVDNEKMKAHFMYTYLIYHGYIKIYHYLFIY